MMLAKRAGKLEVVGVLEAAATERRRGASDEKWGLWSGRKGQDH
jgi:hypothetical protein